MINPELLNYELRSRFIELIESKSGIIFDKIKENELNQELITLMNKHRIDSFNIFYEYILKNENVLKELVNLFTINETFFFRVPEQLDALKYNVLPELLKNKKNRRIGIWSAGCSSGEEPYSIAITLMESGLYTQEQIKIIGTDINENVINIAKRGEYSGRTLNYVSDYILNKYFTKINNKFRINDRIRNMIEFKYLNLVDDFTKTGYLEDIDVIFFRNVLIYFDIKITKKIIENFFKILNSPGFLFLGPSETLLEISESFEVQMLGNTFYYKKKQEKHINKTTNTPTLNKEEKIQKKNILTSPKNQNKTFKCSYNEFIIQIKKSENDELIKNINEYLEKDPFNKKCLILKLLYLLNYGKEVEIKKFYNYIEDTMPLLPELYYLMGNHYKSKSRYFDAISEFKKDLFINHLYILPRIRLLEIYKIINDEQKSRLEAKNILTMIKSGKYEYFENMSFDNIDLQNYIKKEWFKNLLTY